MKIRFFVLTAISVLFGVSPGIAQDAPKPHNLGSLDAAQPGVYMAFDRLGRCSDENYRLLEESKMPKSNNPQDRCFWIRLFNNSVWPIRVPTWSMYLNPDKSAWIPLPKGKAPQTLGQDWEVTIIYELETYPTWERATSDDGVEYRERIDAPPAPEINGMDMSSYSWLPPGLSIVFPVPQDHLKKQFSIYVEFHYEWEWPFRFSEPQHRAYFDEHDLARQRPDGEVVDRADDE